MNKQQRLLFYYLSAFSHTGGIEKFNRCFIKAMNNLPGEAFTSSIVSVYDNESDKRYNKGLSFKGFKKKRGISVLYIISQSFKIDILVLGHINLAIAGVIYKILRPGGRLIVTAHGIETWPKLFFIKKMCLRLADEILSVSNYTKNQLVLRNNIRPQKIRLFPNTIDPYFVLPSVFKRKEYLLDRYGINATQKIVLTLSRISSSEEEKGYYKIITALPSILKVFPDVVYILAGKYDEKEKRKIEALSKEYNVEHRVILTGYVPDEEVPDHYLLADVFIMPSRKEGFGIVFLEALACGSPVIGGNQDGTVDALHNGSLGQLINPTKQNEITQAILNHLADSGDNVALQKQVLDQYRFSIFKERLYNILTANNASARVNN